jgi:tetraacyldisaccharide 4'-kinase
MMLFFNAATSLVWSILTAISRALYALGLRKSVKLPVRVIAVGNFEVGGTGKTPIVAQIAREAIARGQHPVILTRGYGGRWEKTGGVLEPLQPEPLLLQPLEPPPNPPELPSLHRKRRA